MVADTLKHLLRRADALDEKMTDQTAIITGLNSDIRLLNRALFARQDSGFALAQRKSIADLQDEAVDVG